MSNYYPEVYEIVMKLAKNAIILRDESSKELVKEISQKHDIPFIVIEYLIAWAYSNKEVYKRTGSNSPKSAIKMALQFWDYEDKN